MHRKRNGVLLAVIFWNILGPGMVSDAADWSFSPSLDIVPEYSSNVLFTYADKKQDGIISGIPRIQIMGVTEKTRLNLDSITNGKKYIENEELDTILTDNRLSLHHEWTPQTFTELTGTFLRDETLETELELGGISATRKERFRYGANLANTTVRSQRFSLTTTCAFQKTQYPDGPYPDLEMWQAGLNPYVAITPRDTIGVDVSYYFNDYKDVAGVQRLYPMLYWQRALTETAKFTLGAGYWFSWTRYDQTHEETEDNGVIASLVLNKDWGKRLSTTFSGGSEQYITVDVISKQRAFARTGLTYRISDMVRFECSVGYDFTTESSTRGQDTYYLRVAPSVLWKIRPDVSVRLGGGYENEKQDVGDEESTTERIQGRIIFSAQWPRLWASH